MPKKSKSHGLATPYIWAMARISLGLIFLWGFLDKLWGLGYTTCLNAKTGVVTTMCDSAWLQGGSPTTGFLKFATKGPLASFYQNMAGNNVIDVLFMLGLLLIGVALITGVAMRIATVTGALLLLMMWSAALPPEHHPFLDEHVVYALLLVGLMRVNDHQKWGMRDRWMNLAVVRRFPILQ
jgi:thiosulfate dehydrogenase (quinone) large subunit